MKKQRILPLLAPSVGMLVLILDGKTALQGAKEGVELCLRTLIPSLFPFFVLSILLTASLTGLRIPLLRPVGKACHIPAGMEFLLAIGLLGGYPVGAQNVAQAYRTGHLSRRDAQRLLAFCNNAGPAFLFGIIGPFFSSPRVPWILWGIHMLSTLIVGMILPAEEAPANALPGTQSLSLSQALEKAVKVMALVCGWVVLMRMVLTILDRWIFWALPVSLQVFLSGILELSNGCIQLSRIDSEGLRFIFAAVFLAFGGLCVTMQTASVADGLSLRTYFPGKLLQTLVSFLLAVLCQGYFPADARCSVPAVVTVLAAAGCMMLAFFLRRTKKSSSIPALVGV